MWLVINVPGVGPVEYQVPGHTGVILSPVGPKHHDTKAHAHYPELLTDATTVASLQEAAKHVSDEGLREALHGGLKAAIQAMQKRAGSGVTIRE